VKDALSDMAYAFSSSFLYGEELYNSLRSLKVLAPFCFQPSPFLCPSCFFLFLSLTECLLLVKISNILMAKPFTNLF
jgi:hypothetical protein